LTFVYHIVKLLDREADDKETIPMVGANAIKILHEIIEAHGGMAYWNGIGALDLEISARGFLFTAKRRPALNHVRMRAYTYEPRFTFFDFPKPGQTAELLANSRVHILDSEGTVIAERSDPRVAFHGFRHLISWDDLDFIYFAGYATWNYLTTPFMLMRKGFTVEALKPLEGDLGKFTRLQVTFPADVPTHSRQQIFYFDDDRLLRRLDYTAEVVGGWAHAAHFCEDYRTFDKLASPTKRRVLPLPFGLKPLPGPTLVDIDVHDIRPVPLDLGLGRDI
jgi:hypothetical protein